MEPLGEEEERGLKEFEFDSGRAAVGAVSSSAFRGAVAAVPAQPGCVYADLNWESVLHILYPELLRCLRAQSRASRYGIFTLEQYIATVPVLSIVSGDEGLLEMTLFPSPILEAISAPAFDLARAEGRPD
ncbi:hypothetical protein DUI87_23935 [Hirundo rustica rustica]|uniref:Uncharacterized protein n=1 Tax=Hirundo rustica rustica TaxID=333673 RepID=A0A3M0JH33_HIRRU|nr:hypothetical protein DUI87_23935 [Hirundo rustica rustica]